MVEDDDDGGVESWRVGGLGGSRGLSDLVFSRTGWNRRDRSRAEVD